ncbi:hypothetical protein BX616_004070 [Lobosporangium transversale]|uniref:F-box domain-containing protein n=1 Tax=Lobosporangium transversale TaxID=64571 RepID=A0A1Y2H0T0_9FUNG|nr:hypothetical protein BCR41DRAFT_344739 [Lobosporangium transversale]KAF9916318.1 hypothetical protein BX616_004070 [Lobosporangium transversale]ORZ28159.1 hypothetical protein BCR41DRAFT_344739 [Lobosporangium transversale]|eukprot:XP_021885844.1 hypothetical protein BCR41DRAFT_344739 [Lobosporangium transversale]
MNSLPTELLLRIIQVILPEQPTLAACNRINRQWHQLTRRLLYAEPKFHRLQTLNAFIRTVNTQEILDQYPHLSSDAQCSYFDTQHNNYVNHVRAAIDTFGNGDHSNNSTGDSVSIFLGRKVYSKQILSLMPPVPSKLADITENQERIPPGALVETIDLSMLPHRWDTVHAETIQSLVTGCPLVSTLNLSDCKRLRDNAIDLITLRLAGRRLRSLVLSGCNKITDRAIGYLSIYATVLENLEVSKCDRLTDRSLRNLAKAAKCTTPVSDTSEVSTYYGTGKTIKSLDLSFCPLITENGIMHLRCRAPQLTSLNLEGCYGILSVDDLGQNEWEDTDDPDLEYDHSD